MNPSFPLKDAVRWLTTVAVGGLTVSALIAGPSQPDPSPTPTNPRPPVFVLQPRFERIGMLYNLGGNVYSRATALSANGLVVVGHSRNPSGYLAEAVRWTSSGGLQPLGGSPLSGPSTQAMGTNSNGSLVVGSKGYSSFKWTSPTGMQDFNLILGGESSANAISADGSTIVGGADYYLPDGYTTIRAVRHTSSGTTYLPFMAGGNWSEAHAVSANGLVVVGEANRYDNPYSNHAFRYGTATGIWDMGDLAGGASRSCALAVSADGSVVTGWGTINNTGGTEAFRWQFNTGMVGLGQPQYGAVRHTGTFPACPPRPTLRSGTPNTDFAGSRRSCPRRGSRMKPKAGR
jgi:probable HAF family extracellular repeat protein